MSKMNTKQRSLALDFELLRSAVAGDLDADQKRIAETAIQWAAQLIRKNIDYGSSVWQPPALAPDCDPGVAIFVRMSDKVARIGNLASGKQPLVNNEALEDTVADLGSYALLWLARPGN